MIFLTRISISILLLFNLASVAFGQNKTVLIAYYSKDGHTAKMAQSVYKGAREVGGVHVLIKPIDSVSSDILLNADAIILGSPVYNANVAPEMQAFINSWPFQNAPLKDKLGAAFVTSGGTSAGEELVQLNMLHSMMIFGMLIAGGPEWTQPFGASSFSSESPFDKEEYESLYLEKGEKLGKRIAELLLKIN